MNIPSRAADRSNCCDVETETCYDMLWPAKSLEASEFQKMTLFCGMVWQGLLTYLNHYGICVAPLIYW